MCWFWNVHCFDICAVFSTFTGAEFFRLCLSNGRAEKSYFLNLKTHILTFIYIKLYTYERKSQCLKLFHMTFIKNNIMLKNKQHVKKFTLIWTWLITWSYSVKPKRLLKRFDHVLTELINPVKFLTLLGFFFYLNLSLRKANHLELLTYM